MLNFFFTKSKVVLESAKISVSILSISRGVLALIQAQKLPFCIFCWRGLEIIFINFSAKTFLLHLLLETIQVGIYFIALLSPFTMIRQTHWVVLILDPSYFNFFHILAYSYVQKCGKQNKNENPACQKSSNDMISKTYIHFSNPNKKLEFGTQLTNLNKESKQETWTKNSIKEPK